MVGYQVALRTGWIFKTESVVMPAFLDHLGGQGWLRGLLPIFNRLGQSVPPMVSSHWLSRRRQKKRVVATTTLAMSACFLTLAAAYRLLVLQELGAGVMPWLFVITYAVFFSCFGINQLAQNTLQGKIIPVLHRGALMTWGSMIGVVFAVTMAVILLPQLLKPEVAAFDVIFAITGSAFLMAGLLALFFLESDDPVSPDRTGLVDSLSQSLSTAFGVLRRRREFRLFGLVAGAFGMNMVLFPHYQALFRHSLGTNLQWLLPWLVSQNLGAAFFSAISGRIADRIGNGLALRLMLVLQIAIPLLSLGCSLASPESAWLTLPVFFALGSTPVTYRLFSNFTLELVDRAQHPAYLSALAICLSFPPMLLSGVTGWLVDQLGFPAVFLTVAGIVTLGFLLMLWVPDPRHQPPHHGEATQTDPAIGAPLPRPQSPK